MVYSVFHLFRITKFAYGDSVQSSIQFATDPWGLEVGITDLKIIISLPWYKSVKQTVIRKK
jgi:hypothetical protein